jgi:alpha-galactosidase
MRQSCGAASQAARRLSAGAILFALAASAQVLELHGLVENQPVTAAGRQPRLPLDIQVNDRTWGRTGVTTRDITLVNRGAQPLRVQHLPSLHWQLPKGEYTLTYLYGGWGQERQVATEKLAAGRRAFLNGRGRSTSLYSPWFYLHNDTTGAGYMAQLAWSGNWEMSFERLPGAGNALLEDQELAVELGVRFDFGGPLALQPGERFELPRVAVTTATGDLDDAANQLHRFQRQYVFARNAANQPPLVQFNSWYPFSDAVDAEKIKRAAGVAAEIGAEAFVLDSGWYSTGDWQKTLGDWQVSREKFPNGLEEVSAYVRGKGMKFGLWTEIENAGPQSRVFREHPGWFFQRNGAPLAKGDRYHLDFARPAVRAWAKAVVDRLVRDYKLGWIKIDYNVDEGDEFDSPRGDALYRHILGYYAWLDDIRAAHPELIIENCSSGGLRFDLGIVAHTHTTWLSDMVEPLPSLQLAYGCTLEFAPEVCNHWMVGDAERGFVDLAKPPEWWDFLFRVPMNGQFGISSRVFDWSPELKRRAAENVALYKRLRGLIASADVYHLTPPPSHNRPQGWMAIEYAAPDRRRAAVMAYRLEHGAPRQSFRLRGLDPSLGESLEVSLDADFRAAAIELPGKP